MPVEFAHTDMQPLHLEYAYDFCAYQQGIRPRIRLGKFRGCHPGITEIMYPFMWLPAFEYPAHEFVVNSVEMSAHSVDID